MADEEEDRSGRGLSIFPDIFSGYISKNLTTHTEKSKLILVLIVLLSKECIFSCS